MILFLLSLLAGIFTVLAPCTISLLPVIVGGSLNGGQNFKRALVVTASLGLSVIVFTLLLKVSSSLISIPQEFWQLVSGGIILGLGLTMLFPSLWESLSFTGLMNRSANRLLATGYKKQSFAGDMLVGAALGPVFSSCSPTYFLILATVLPRSLTEGMVYLLAYTVGLCGALLIITVASQKLLERFGVASDPKGWLKRGIGILFLLLGIAIVFGYDKKLELVIANNIFDVTKIEQHLLATQQKDSSKPTQNSESELATTTTDGEAMKKPMQDSGTRMGAKASAYERAPEITNPSGFVNTDGKPITFGEFRGKKVVLVDFWTYSCINCQRTLPYLKAWYEKYHDQGLEIISVHTPEFAFEKVQTNVERAVKDDGLKYPVVLDNDYGTWNAFGNQYWPRKYLIDIDGYIVYDHVGEGAYDVTEKAIQKTLAERASILSTGDAPTGIVAPANVIAPEMGKVRSPEVYFGSARNKYLGNGTSNISGEQTFKLPESFSKNTLYLSGKWYLNSEYAESKEVGAKIIYKYKAKEVYFVASSASGATLKILVDGKPIGLFAGADVAPAGAVKVQENRLYKLIHGSDYSEHTLEIQIESGTLEAYTFTFG